MINFLIAEGMINLILPGKHTYHWCINDSLNIVECNIKALLLKHQNNNCEEASWLILNGNSWHIYYLVYGRYCFKNATCFHLFNP